MNFDKLAPHQIHWDYFTNYYKNCDNVGMRGGVYALVFAPTKPKPYEHPCEFEQCVYIGKSTGNYYDRQMPHRGKMRSHIHKRMTDHFKPLMTGKGGDSSHNSIINEYGYGRPVLDGTLTSLPLWLCIMTPRPDLPDDIISRWALTLEQLQLYNYHMNFGHTTLGNMDTKENKNPDSYSSYHMASIKECSLEKFFI